MSLMTISIGRCGLDLHSTLAQYSADYISYLTDADKLSYYKRCSGDNAFADAIKRLYFKDLIDPYASALCPRNITIGSDMQCLDYFDKGYLCRELYNNIKNQDDSTKCVFVDKPTDWKYDLDSFIQLSEPSCDIWSNGYNNASKLKDEIECKLIKEIEEADSLNGVLSLASLGGGTGSGAGTFVYNMISDELPKVRHIIAAVSPFTYGEFSTQSINSILSLSTAYDNSDGIIYISNDKHIKISEHQSGSDDIKMQYINGLYGLSLFHTLRPISNTCVLSNNIRYNKPLDYIIDGLCSYSSLKLLNIRLLPLDKSTNLQLKNRSHHQMIGQITDMINVSPIGGEYAVNEKINVNTKDLHSKKTKTVEGTAQTVLQDYYPYKNRKVKHGADHVNNRIKRIPIVSPSLNNISVMENSILTNTSQSHMHGADKLKSIKGIRLISNVGTKRHTIEKYNVIVGSQINLGGIVKESINFGDLHKDVLFWKYSTRPVQVSYCPNDVGVFGNVTSHLSNCQEPLSNINYLLTSAKMMYASNAYIHKYRECGLEETELEESIINVEGIKGKYDKLTNEVLWL